MSAVARRPTPLYAVLKTSVGAFSIFENLLLPQWVPKEQDLLHSIINMRLRQSSPQPLKPLVVASSLEIVQSHSIPKDCLLHRLKKLRKKRYKIRLFLTILKSLTLRIKRCFLLYVQMNPNAFLFQPWWPPNY